MNTKLDIPGNYHFLGRAEYWYVNGMFCREFSTYNSGKGCGVNSLGPHPLFKVSTIPGRIGAKSLDQLPLPQTATPTNPKETLGTLMRRSR